MPHSYSSTNLAEDQLYTQAETTLNFRDGSNLAYPERDPIPTPPSPNSWDGIKPSPQDQLNFKSQSRLKLYEVDSDVHIEAIDIIKHRKHIQNISPYQHKRLLGCGSIYLEFRTANSNNPYYLKNNCHSLVCPVCCNNDRRRGLRIIQTIGEELIKFCPWYELVGTIPKRLVKDHYLDNEKISKFQSDFYEILMDELGLWKNLSRFDRSGGIYSPHWFGSKEPGYSFHSDMMIPAIRDGKAIQQPEIPRDKWDEFHKRVCTRMAMRMGNDVGEKLSYKEMNFHLSVAYDPAKVSHRISYMTRNTVKEGKLHDFEYFHKEEKIVQEFLCDGRIGKNGVVYKGKLAGGELKEWYKYLGLDYENRNSEGIRKWIDSDGEPVEFEKVTTRKELAENNIKTIKVGKGLFTRNNQIALDEKFNDQLSNIIPISTSKLLERKVTEWEKMLQGNKVNWSKTVIKKCLERRIYIVENSNITSKKCLEQVRQEKINLKSKKTREETKFIGEVLFLETVLSGLNYKEFIKDADPNNVFLAIGRFRKGSLTYKEWEQKYNDIDNKIGVKQNQQTISLFNEYVFLLDSICSYDPGGYEEIRDYQRRWREFENKVSSYLRNEGYIDLYKKKLKTA